MKQTQRLREQTCGCQGAAKEGWAGSLELADVRSSSRLYIVTLFI